MTGFEDLKFWFWNLLIPGVILYIIFTMSKPLLVKLQKKGYALLLNHIQYKQNLKLSKRKVQLFADMHDMSSRVQSSAKFTVLEVGAGAGANFKFFPDGTDVICLDPNPYFDVYLRKNADVFPHVNLKQFVVGFAEDMSRVPDNSVDAVVCTMVLCSVTDIVTSLKEIKRILKPGGKFFYIEHIEAKDGTFQNKLQYWLNPFWSYISDGCRLNSNTASFINDTGFSSIDHETIFITSRSVFGKISWPSILRHVLIGSCVK